MKTSIIFICAFIISLLAYLILFGIVNFIFKHVKNYNNRLLNPIEYIPEEEFHTLKQVFYLIMMVLFFLFILYDFVLEGVDIKGVCILEIIVIIYVSSNLKYDSWKTKLLFFLMIPYGSIAYLLLGENSIISILDILNLIAYVYLMKIYYDKFKNYTETNGLGIAIILLFSIVFISFLNTSIVEDTGPLNALVMVSNAFTSNGYAVLGKSSLGKINSILLVWGGYILSGVGTATLTAAILTKHFNRKFDALEELIKNNNKKE